METLPLKSKSSERVLAFGFRNGAETILTLRGSAVRRCEECGRNVEKKSFVAHARKHHGTYS